MRGQGACHLSGRIALHRDRRRKWDGLLWEAALHTLRWNGLCVPLWDYPGRAAKCLDDWIYDLPWYVSDLPWYSKECVPYHLPISRGVLRRGRR